MFARVGLLSLLITVGCGALVGIDNEGATLHQAPTGGAEAGSPNQPSGSVDGSADASVNVPEEPCDKSERPNLERGIFVDANASAAGNGSIDAPLRSLTDALAAVSATKDEIYLAAGEYFENETLLVSGVRKIVGGWATTSTSWERACGPRTTLYVFAPTALRAAPASTTPMELRSMVVHTGPRESTPGMTTLGLDLANAQAAWRIVDVTLDVDRAGDGLAGTAAAPASGCQASSSCASGQAGTPGSPGAPGNQGSYGEAGYVPGNGGDGQPGQPGQAGAEPEPALCRLVKGCDSNCDVTDYSACAGSSSCGCGGNAGAAGSGGAGGGASIGVFASGAVALDLERVLVRTAGGGNGGAAGPGGAGADGGQGEGSEPYVVTEVRICLAGPSCPPTEPCPMCTEKSKVDVTIPGSPPGGNGGRGGNGGDGGLGAGGDSVGIALVGAASITAQRDVGFDLGAAGDGGTDGRRENVLLVQ